MASQLTIRPEQPGDIDSITRVTAEAFSTLEISNHTEHHIVLALRSAGALSVSLVAESEKQILGHIAFSPVTFPDETPRWYGLGPVSVLPARQRQGIGKALIREGLSALRTLNARGCCVVGHPEYYGQFGFVHPPGLGMEGVPAEVFFALAFDDDFPTGSVTFHPAFGVDAPPADHVG